MSEVDECAQLRGWLRNTLRVSHQSKPSGRDPRARDESPPRYSREPIQLLANENAELSRDLDAHAGQSATHTKDVAAMRTLFTRAERLCHFEPIARSPEPALPAHPELHRAAAQIQQVVRAGFDRLRACYEEGLGRSPGLQGKVMTFFAIAPDGRVTNVEDAGSSLPDRRVVDCVLHGFEALSFPPESVEVTLVQYPIVFNPGE